jgi:hypothetical protein
MMTGSGVSLPLSFLERMNHSDSNNKVCEHQLQQPPPPPLPLQQHSSHHRPCYSFPYDSF